MYLHFGVCFARSGMLLTHFWHHFEASGPLLGFHGAHCGPLRALSGSRQALVRLHRAHWGRLGTLSGTRQHSSGPLRSHSGHFWYAKTTKTYL